MCPGFIVLQHVAGMTPGAGDTGRGPSNTSALTELSFQWGKQTAIKQASI